MLDETPVATLESVVGRLNAALEGGDAKAAAALFQADSYWRDLVAFTWNFRTMEGPEQIVAMLEDQLAEDRAAQPPPRSRRNADRERQRHRRLDRVRDRDRPRLRPHPAEGRSDLDAAHHPRPS